MLIVFDVMIADMEASKKLSPLVTELFMEGRKLKIFNYNLISKCLQIGRKVAHYFITKISNKRELQQMALNNQSDVEFKDFRKLYIDYTKILFSLLANDTTSASDNTVRFRKNLL